MHGHTRSTPARAAQDLRSIGWPSSDLKQCGKHASHHAACRAREVSASMPPLRLGSHLHKVDRGQLLARLYLLSRLDRAATRFPALMRAAGRVEALLLEGLFCLSRCLSPDQASALGDRLGGMLGPRLKKHRDVVSNLSIAFPDWPASRLRAVAVAAWRQAGRTVMEFPHLGALSSPTATDRIEIVHLADLSARAAWREARDLRHSSPRQLEPGDCCCLTAQPAAQRCLQPAAEPLHRAAVHPAPPLHRRRDDRLQARQAAPSWKR